MAKEFLSESNRQMKSFVTLKFAFSLICTAVLIYQTVDLIEEYFSYKTIVIVEIDDHNSAIQFPSVSICEKYPKIGATLNNISVTSRLPIGSALSLLKAGILIKGEDSVLGHINFNERKKWIENKSHISDHTLMKDTFGPLIEESVKCMFYKNRQSCYPNVHTSTSLAQCRTYFSEISSSVRVTQKVVKKVKSHESEETNNFMATFYINLTEYKYENILKRGGIFIVIHDSNTTPDDQKVIYASRRFLLKQNKNYDLLFSKKSITRLPKPYKTQCYNYKEDMNSTNIYGLSRGLCSLKCRTESTLSKYNCLRFGAELIYSDKYSKSKLCNISIQTEFGENNIFEYEYFESIKCFEKCRTECVQQVFNYELHEVERSDSDIIDRYYNSTLRQNITLVTLMAKQSDEISYVHLPKMRLTDLWCSLGGLFSLWLGLSVLTIYDKVIAICVKLISIV